MFTVQVAPLAVVHPVQLLNCWPLAGVAVRVTVLFNVNGATQVAPQLIPAGLLVTVPLPVLVTVSVGLKVARTVLAAVIFTVQVAPLAVSQPLQPANCQPVAGVAVRVAVASLRNAATQSLPQLIPDGTLVTVPLPVLVAVRV